MEIVKIIEKSTYLSHLFRDFEENELNKIEVCYFASDIQMIRKESTASNVYLLVSGICGIFKELENGETFCYYKISSYDIIGLGEILEFNQTRYANVKTLSDVIAFKIKKTDLLNWMALHPEFYNELIGNVISRLHNTLTKHVESKKYNTQTNVVSYLLHSYTLYHKGYGDGYKGSVKINETREMISDFIGISIRSTNSSIEVLKNLNLINVKHGKIYMNEEQYDQMMDYKMDLLM